MKKFVLILMILSLLILPIVMMGSGDKETEEKIEIVLIHSYGDYYQTVLDQYTAENPEVELILVKIGGVVAVDTLLAVKDPPNVYMSTPGNLGKFMIPGFALELTEDNIKNLADFKPGTLDIYYRDGQLLGLPVTVAVNAFDLNLTLAEQVGIDISKYEGRDFLTIPEFLEFARLIKERGPEGTYSTAIWAGNLGSQQINFHWLTAFGARFFENADYSHTIINSPEAVQGLKFMKYLVDMGYAPPEALVLDDDEAIAMWAAGKLGGLWARAGGWLTMIDNAIKQGMSDEKFDHQFMTWPVADGIDSNPLSNGGAAGMVIASGDEKTDILAARLLDMMTGRTAQSRTIAPGAGYVTRYSALEPPQDPWPAWADVIEDAYEKAKAYDPGFVHYTRISELYNTYGLLDTGASTVYSSALSGEWLKVFQPFMKGDITAEEALITLEREFNKILAGED